MREPLEPGTRVRVVWPTDENTYGRHGLAGKIGYVAGPATDVENTIYPVRFRENCDRAGIGGSRPAEYADDAHVRTFHRDYLHRAPRRA